MVHFSYNQVMVTDDVRNLSSYRPLDESIGSVSEAAAEELPVFRSFHVNTAHSVLFTVENGSITASTSWRENPGSMEATAAVRAGKGHFVLYLPGEPYLVKADSEDTEAVMRVLGSRNGS